jgi:CheY-like chemotaxis protein/HPt (histidine-containing phosphotransfer) domain-containing protein
VASEILRRGGYSFVHAETGFAAVEAVLQERFDVVLMDCQLPELDGYEAARRIRALEAQGRLAGADGSRRRLAILALTASATKGNLERCLAAGMDDYIAKPVDARKLLQAVASRLEPAQAPPDAGRGEVDGSTERPPPVADLSRALGRLLGNRMLLATLIEGFVDEALPARAKLEEAVLRRDSAAVAFAAHRLRGQAAAFDAAPLVAALERAESECRNESWEAVDAAFEAVGTRLEELLLVLRAAISA